MNNIVNNILGKSIVYEGKELKLYIKNNTRVKKNMANRDGTGPRSGSRGPRDGSGGGFGRAGGIGVGRRTGGRRGSC